MMAPASVLIEWEWGFHLLAGVNDHEKSWEVDSDMNRLQIQGWSFVFGKRNRFGRTHRPNRANRESMLLIQWFSGRNQICLGQWHIEGANTPLGRGSSKQVVSVNGWPTSGQNRVQRGGKEDDRGTKGRGLRQSLWMSYGKRRQKLGVWQFSCPKTTEWRQYSNWEEKKF